MTRRWFRSNPKPDKLPDEGEFTGDLATLRNKIRG